MRFPWMAILATLLSSPAAFAQSKDLPPLPPPPEAPAAPAPSPGEPSSGVEYAPAPSPGIVYTPAPPTASPPPAYTSEAAARPTPPADPDPPWAPGFYLRMNAGLSVVSLQLAGPTPAGQAAVGVATDVAVGGTLHGGVSIAATLGFEQDTLSSSDSANNQLLLVDFGALVDWHPSLDHGWHVGGGVELCSLDLERYSFTNTGVDAKLSLLGGYDWRLSRRWGIGVQARASYLTATTLHGDDDSVAGGRFHAASLALDATALF